MLRFLWLPLALGCVVALPLQAEPYVPDDPGTVLLRVAPDDNAEVARLRRLRSAARAAPGNSALVARFARAAIEYARAEADPRWYGYAETVLAHWDDRETVPASIRVLRATIAQHRHRFEAALAELDAVVAGDADHAQARLTRAVIHSVQARYDAALRDCAALQRFGELLTLSCMATPRSLSGQAEATLAQLDAALAGPGGAASTRLWALTVAAEIAERLGRDDARSRYERALAAEGGRKDRYLQLAFADFLLRADAPADVAGVLAGFEESTDARIRLMRARAMQGESVDPAPLRARLDAIRARRDLPHYREEAMLALHLEDRPGEALWLARENWRDQKEPADALLLLQAAVATRRPEAAAPVREWMREHGVEDRRLDALLDALREKGAPGA